MSRTASAPRIPQQGVREIMKRRFQFSIVLAGLLLAGSALAQVDQLLEPMGGGGGGPFIARCAGTDILNGFELRTGDDVDAIRPICVSAYAPDVSGPRHAYPQSFGGDGGAVVQLLCPDNAPAIAGVYADMEGEKTVIINNIHLFCSIAVPNQPMTEHPTAAFDGPYIGGSRTWYLTPGTQTCPAGLVPVGINGRSGIWLDAFGLICGALHLDASKLPPAGKVLGRVDSPSSPHPPRSLCEAAADARARNSPIASHLEEQCRALGAPANSAPTSTPAPAPAAITAADLQMIGARGAALANGDAMAAELRRRIADVAVRRGFDIGAGIWGSDTAPGPGKQRFRDVMPASEQRGFDLAAAFFLPRNKHAVPARVGASIAKADRDVGRARVAEDDVFYWLGFDIASGLFGNPAAGAEGSTVVGPGAIAIRSELNAAGQRGFTASTQFHLSRKYR
jgi:hypothetical protein